jgi:hypothetical protein
MRKSVKVIALFVLFAVCGPSISHGAPSFACHRPQVSTIDQLGLVMRDQPETIQMRKNIRVNGRLQDALYALPIKDVEKGTLADTVGLKKGDKIFKIRGFFLERTGTKRQMENILNHHNKKISLFYFRDPFPEPRVVTLVKPESICKQYENLYQLASALSHEVNAHSTNARVASLGAEDFTQEDLSQKLQAHDLSDPPTCESNEDAAYLEKCHALITQIQDLGNRTAILQATLDETPVIADQDTTPLEEERLNLAVECGNIMRAIYEDRWKTDRFFTHANGLKDLDSRWRTHKAKLIQLQGTHTKEAREYTALWKAWKEDFKNISKQLNELQLHKQTAARKKEEAGREQVRVAKNQAMASLIERHGAKDLTKSPQLTLSLAKNPFAYKDGHVFVQGLYVKNIEDGQALIDLAPALSLHEYVIQMATNTNLALQQSMTQCVVEVMGTTNIMQGGIEREIPHVKEIECLP